MGMYIVSDSSIYMCPVTIFCWVGNCSSVVSNNITMSFRRVDRRYNPYYMLIRFYEYYEGDYSFFLTHCRNLRHKVGNNHRQLK